MRILGFSKKWDKLKRDEFTTFRYPRKDSDKGRDWHEGEILKIVYQPRHQNEYLGIAQVISKDLKNPYSIDDEEAVADGFNNWSEMADFLKLVPTSTINKLTLRWIEHPVTGELGEGKGE
jgi:hypothetical protein